MNPPKLRLTTNRMGCLTAAQRNALTKAVPALSALAVAIDQLADTADTQPAD